MMIPFALRRPPWLAASLQPSFSHRAVDGDDVTLALQEVIWSCWYKMAGVREVGKLGDVPSLCVTRNCFTFPFSQREICPDDCQLNS